MGDWVKAQHSDGSVVWVMAELLVFDLAAAELLPEATDIPAPPPLKVGTVAEQNLNLRDGPGTIIPARLAGHTVPPTRPMSAVGAAAFE